MFGLFSATWRGLLGGYRGTLQNSSIGNSFVAGHRELGPSYLGPQQGHLRAARLSPSTAASLAESLQSTLFLTALCTRV